MNRYLSVIIKPTLACNMACRHCYHSPEERSSEGRISFERLEKLFRIASRDYESVWFIWHGGEPLELPLSFWKKAIELQEKYFGNHTCGNTIQTNGLNIDRKFLEFCRKKQINIGVSHEGPYDDLLRTDCSKVEDTIRKMSDKGRVFSVSSTISKGDESSQLEIYRHFSDIGTSLSMVPVIPAGCAAAHRELVPDPDAYIRSSIEAFDAWLHDRDTEMPLSPHFLYVMSALGDPQPSDCAHSSCLTRWVCLYPNGDLYPCAKACPSSMKLCNIDSVNAVPEAFRTEGFAEILKGTIARREKCQKCDVYDYCQGGCSIDAYYEEGIGNNGNPSCRIFREVFLHIKKEMDSIISEKKDLSQYNRFVRDAVLGKLVNPVMQSP
ncbi:Arylsulfatase regulator (Fe-S oxidoreductase) [Thermoplasmatales archaeon BRNA1]|nr:Arylsulfatase regulator (Fe-S oxidoreductase) [Thermoplasmatales archaeon BRNA1]